MKSSRISTQKYENSFSSIYIFQLQNEKFFKIVILINQSNHLKKKILSILTLYQKALWIKYLKSGFCVLYFYKNFSVLKFKETFIQQHRLSLKRFNKFWNTKTFQTNDSNILFEILSQ